ncbi:MAG: Transcriptional regulator, LuxR family protein [Myxococcaceae bacterium]|nr:Transcriptional regulator, LuxR family protein [Myxococcaceae bacterium]
MDHVSFDRARQLFLLLGELHELRRDNAAVLDHLTTGLLALVPAQVVILGSLEGQPDAPVLHGIAEKGWIDRAARVRVSDFFQRNALNADPLARAITAVRVGHGRVLSARRRDLVTRRDWHDSAYFCEVRRPNGDDDAIYSQRLLFNGHREAIGLTRAANDRPFSDQDRSMMHLAHLGLATVLDRAAHGTKLGPVLSPRERQTLAALLRGCSDKEIAEELGIRRSTVNKHVMAIFRGYAVASRAQLMAKLLGDDFTAP